MHTKTYIYEPLLNDIVFKYIFGYNKNIKYTEYLLELLFNFKSGSLKDRVEILNSFKLDKTSYKERGFEIDVRIKMPDDSYINLEAYTSFNDTSRLKSLMYLSHMFSHHLYSGERRKNAKQHLQINLVKGPSIKSRNYTIISEEEPRDYFIKDYFYIRVINVDEYNNIRYNELNKLQRLLRFMSATSDEEEKEIIKGDEILEKMYEDKWKFLQDEWANEFFTHDNYIASVHNAEMEEKDEVIQEKDEAIQEKDIALQNAIKNFLKQNISLEEISNIMNLSIEKIEEILNK